MRRLLALCASLALCGPLVAIDEDGPLPDPQMQVRYERLTNELRCLVCQNQTVADSNADLAKDLRKQTREMILAGKSDEEIKRFMTDRYGDFVLYKPPLGPHTILLWAAPGLMLLIGLGVAFAVIRRRSQETAPVAGGGEG